MPFRPDNPLFILILVLIVLLLFGAKRLPDLTRSVGKSLRILKTEVRSLRDDEDEDDKRPGTAERPAEPGTAERRPLEGRAVDEARAEQRARDEQHRPSS